MKCRLYLQKIVTKLSKQLKGGRGTVKKKKNEGNTGKGPLRAISTLNLSIKNKH